MRPKLILSILIIILAILVFIANLQLIFPSRFLTLKDNIENNLSKALGQDFSAEEINFSFYGRLKLIKVKITSPGGTAYAAIKEVDINFNSLLLLLGRIFFINEITLIEPEIFYPAKDLKINVPSDGFTRGSKLKLSSQLALKAKSGHMVLDEGRRVGFNFWARLEGDRKIYSEGRVNLYFPEPFRNIKYKLQAACSKQDLDIKELIFDFDQFKIEGSGAVKNYNSDNPVLDLKIALKEFNFLETAQLKTKFFISNLLNLILQIKGELKEPRWFIRLDKLRTKFPYLPAELEIDNFYANLKLSKDEFVVEDLACFINSFPVGLKGRVYDFQKPGIEFTLVSYPGQIASLQALNPLNFIFNFSGYKEENSLKGKFSFKVDQLISVEPKRIHTLELSAEEIWCKWPDANNSNLLGLEAKGILCQDSRFDPDVIFKFSNFLSSALIKGSTTLLNDLTLSGYDGSLEGSGFLDFKKFPPVFFLNFEGYNFSLNKLAEAFKLDYELYGKIGAKGMFNSHEDPFFWAETNATNGYIKNMKLLHMLSDFLSVPSVKDIYFDDFSSKFSFSSFDSEVAVSLDQAKLRGKNLYIDANLKFGQKQRMEGDILLRLSKKTLKESSKLRALFSLVKDRRPYTDFEFKVGGLTSAPRIQWLEGKLRSYLMHYVSKPGRRAIEKRLDEALDPLIKDK